MWLQPCVIKKSTVDVGVFVLDPLHADIFRDSGGRSPSDRAGVRHGFLLDMSKLSATNTQQLASSMTEFREKSQDLEKG